MYHGAPILLAVHMFVTGYLADILDIGIKSLAKVGNGINPKISYQLGPVV